MPDDLDDHARVARARRRGAARAIDRAADSRAFLAKHELGRELPLRHDSRERLFSLEARATFVPPELVRLP
jgi:hypothetical protein